MRIPAHYLENNVHYLIKEDIRVCTLIGHLWMLVVEHGNFVATVHVPPVVPLPEGISTRLGNSQDCISAER